MLTPKTAKSINIQRHVDIQRDRLIKVSKACDKYKSLQTSPGYQRHKAIFYPAPRYNWSYCKIGKIGSTRMTQFFYILHHDGETIKDVLVKNREDIHTLENKHDVQGVGKSKSKSTRMILSARNPYTRLFSAYIDRMYIPSTSISVRGKNDPKCKTEITFSEFLQYVVNNTRQGIFDYHWSPVFYLCKPCEINPAFLLKQETFYDDFFYAINQTKLESYKRDVLLKVIETESNWTGYALIDDVLDYVTPTNHRHARDCQTWEQITKRLWDALKIQGFISEKAPFPNARYKNQEDFKKSNIFREIVKDARSNYPLSKTGRSLQRQTALNKYYDTVDSEIIEGIKEVYSADFDMFGYSYNPPHGN